MPGSGAKTLLRDGLVVDGTGAPGRRASVLLVDDRIEAIGALDVDDAEVIDCSGKVIAPGFVDAHSHMDFYAAAEDPRYFDSFTAQGVTTFIAGNCGFSPFGFARDTNYRHLLESSPFKSGRDARDWSTFEEYCALLEALGLTQNFLHFVGHGAARTSIAGFDARPLTTDEHDQMLTLLDDAMLQGAAGVSLGLQYKPGVFAENDELDEVARLVKSHDRLLTVHARAYSSFSGTYPMVPFGRPHNLKAIEDMLGVARRTGVRLQFSHMVFVGSQTWKTVDEALSLFDDAIAEGVDVMFDMFPYSCGATLLNTLLPKWFMAGMPHAIHRVIPRVRLRIQAGLGFRVVGFDYSDIQITNARSSEYDRYNGWFVPEIAKEVGKSNFEALLDILDKSHAHARVLFHGYYTEAIVDRLMQHPAAIFASDAWPEPGGYPNPALSGSFPRFLHNARERQTLSLEATVHKMTGAAAKRFHLEERGQVRVGGFADVVVFDWARAGDGRAGDERGGPQGIEHVFINGVAALRQGEVLPQRGAGRVLLSA